MSKWPGFDLHAELIADVERRFWSNVQKTSTCWLWTGRASADGYGRIKVAGRERTATVVSWTLHFGPVPPMGIMCHHCDNPPCIRPEHLFLGDHSLNGYDLNLKKQQVSGVVPRNEGDLLERIEQRKAEIEAIRSAENELKRLDRVLARENRRHEKATARIRTSAGLYVPHPEEVEARRRAAAEGLRPPVPMYFNDEEIRQIRAVPKYVGICDDLGRQFNVSAQSIRQIRSRRTYAHVSDLPGPDLTRKEDAS